MIVYGMNGGGGGGATSFLELTDTPSSYADQAYKGLHVNSMSNALEFIPIATDFTTAYLLKFTKPVDPDNDPLHFNAQLDCEMDFATPLYEVDTRAGEDGVDNTYIFNGTIWVNYPADGAGAAYDNELILHKIRRSDVQWGYLAYYLRVRFHDGTSWGDWSGGAVGW